MSDDKDHSDPAQARSDLIEILSHDPENTEAIVTIIRNELADLKDGEAVTNALKTAAKSSKVDAGARDNVLYWLTETTPDVRQMILVQTIEELLGMPQCKDATINALSQISTEENVKMVMEWVERKILKLHQAIYVLLYPDSSATLK
ncbi:MAG: hypothetical protein ACFFBJ_12760 [Promethearchaeota archaeon]|jgi:hypothetical protein